MLVDKEVQKIDIEFIHHGAVNGVTGSCHQINIEHTSSYLVDCGLFQGAEASDHSTKQSKLDSNNSQTTNLADHAHSINFPLDNIIALLVTHCHIDHVGRIPYLLAAGFRGPIYCSSATAKLLPLVIEDAVKVGVSKNKQLINKVLTRLQQQLVAVDYHQWQAIASNDKNIKVKIKFKPAGHILGSAYIELDIIKELNFNQNPNLDTDQAINNATKKSSPSKLSHRVVFSGDLGACNTPLLPAPTPPYGCDTLIIESTYGDKNHHGRKLRRQNLERILKSCISDKGLVLIPAFSIGRTQELLYEIEEILHQLHRKQYQYLSNDEQLLNQISVIVDSPLANEFTEHYKELKQHWDNEAKIKLSQNRHPLSFKELYCAGDHQEHLNIIDFYKQNQQPAIIIAASGMCSGGRIVNYLASFIEDKTTDILFVGYQAKGTLGRDIINFSSKKDGYVHIDHTKSVIKAGVHNLSGYSAHADQHDLLRFIKRMRKKPKHIRIVHGDDKAKQALQQKIQHLVPNAKILIPKD
ncbi:MAG: MBL fold metallo-hydrolase [Thalassotalea sp.]|nr:MBL fold metallo-hydrolase [Thalassotalea sp.]